MSPNQSEHREVALKLLLGRSLALRDGALPWSAEEDWTLIERERALWVLLSEEERASEQAWLAELWAQGKKSRVFEIEVEGKPEEVQIVNDAFGLPRADYRPSAKGAPPSQRSEPVQWLWSMGFQVVLEESDKHLLLVQTPKNRVVPEADRLVGLLKRHKRGYVSVLACYDPSVKAAWLEVKGLV
jgi:hypothetical protein